MALKDPRSGRWWSRLHFGIRFIGVTAALAALVGLTVILIDGALEWELLRASWDRLVAAIQGEGQYPRKAMLLLMGGVVVGLFWLFLEALIVIRMVAGRRSAFGFNVVVQIALATALLVGVNVYSSQHYLRLDLTSDQRFTLPTESIDIPGELAKLDIPGELAKLKDTTTILVYIRHRSFGQASDKPDTYESAAERQVAEKVRDLAAQFHEFGPAFKVEVLDSEDKDYHKKYRQLARAELQAKGEDTKDPDDGTINPAVKKRARELRDIVEKAPENSIFFMSGDRIQRMSFNDLYQLDRVASKKSENKKEEEDDAPGSNLVLNYQGVEPFARRALNIDQKRPRVGIAVIHEWLSTRGGLDEYTMAGLKKALESRGMDVRDIMVRRWSRVRPPEPAVYTYDEFKYETNAERADLLARGIAGAEKEQKLLLERQAELKNSTLDELSKKYGQKVTRELRDFNLALCQQSLEFLEQQIAQARDRRDKALKENAGLNVDRLAEQRRLTDLKAKFDRELADIDLLVLPRMTLMNLAEDQYIPNDLYQLDKAQVAAIKDYIKAGKPVLVCFGPVNEPPQQRGMRPPTEQDELEDLLAQLGVRLGKTTVMFTAESQAFAERRTGLQVAGLDVKLPPADFDWAAGAIRRPGQELADETPQPDHPIRRGMRLAQRSLGTLELPARYPRPVTVSKEKRAELAFDPEIMVTSADTWNEDNPFPTDDRIPSYEPPKPDDPRNKTFDAKRRGPFPIAVAMETTVPAEWYSDKPQQPKTARLVVIGDGGLFVGRELSPAKERLLLYTCNWLLGRDDLLPRKDPSLWKYPRVELNKRDRELWHYGAWLGLPVLFCYIGLVVMFVRRLR
jgi:hypothetical protein